MVSHVLIQYVHSFTFLFVVTMKATGVTKAKAAFVVSQLCIFDGTEIGKLMYFNHRQRGWWLDLWVQPIFLVFCWMLITSLRAYLHVAHRSPNSRPNTPNTCANNFSIIRTNKNTNTFSYVCHMVRSHLACIGPNFICFAVWTGTTGAIARLLGEFVVR